MKKAKNKRRGPGFIPLLVMLVLIAVVGVELVKMVGDINSSQSTQVSMEKQIQQVTQENDTLRSDLEKADDLDFILEKAREEGDYVFPNERVFIDIHGVGN